MIRMFTMKSNNMITAKDVPPFMRDPGIIFGYRKPGQPWMYYVKSIFQFHNETLNIWTHIIGVLIHAVLLYNGAILYNLYNDKESFPVLIFGLSCLVSTMLSVITHIFHSKNIDVHYNLFLLDYIGVSLYAFASGIIALYCFSDGPTYNVINSVYFYLHWILCCVDFAVICITKMNHIRTSQQWLRKIAITICFFFHSVLLTTTVARKYWLFLGGDTSNLTSILKYNWIYFLFLLQAVAYGCHLPEYLFPGTFDIVGQSHQLFHVAATFTQILQINAVKYEITAGNTSYGNPNLLLLVTSVTVLIITDLCTILLVKRYLNIDSIKRS